MYRNRVRHVWVREFSEEGKCHFHLALFFKKKMLIIIWEIMRLKVIYG
ncbi:TPA: inovirus-type Gp2 protein [Serratia marcescens]